mmetsp:Transcript_75921/g.93232  ORF Transcript_75921/g.93232 Transcript_75921/m.93232 type:complete len:135 (-) Transcript_75921:98-502(-)
MATKSRITILRRITYKVKNRYDTCQRYLCDNMSLYRIPFALFMGAPMITESNGNCYNIKNISFKSVMLFNGGLGCLLLGLNKYQLISKTLIVSGFGLGILPYMNYDNNIKNDDEFILKMFNDDEYSILYKHVHH